MTHMYLFDIFTGCNHHYNDTDAKIGCIAVDKIVLLNSTNFFFSVSFLNRNWGITSQSTLN